MKQKKPTGRKPPPPRRSVGYDAAGHMDPNEANRLRELSERERSDPAKAFAEATRDDLARELGQAAVQNMTTGEDALRADLEAEVEEDLGGPFVETSGNTEFAGGTDESNIETATREPFPTSNKPPKS
jgi:hypothetical protein